MDQWRSGPWNWLEKQDQNEKKKKARDEETEARIDPPDTCPMKMPLCYCCEA